MARRDEAPALPEQNVSAAPEPIVVFREFERIETTTGVQVTRENMLDIAQHFGWTVEFEGDKREPVLKKGDGYSRKFHVGDWITEQGNAREHGLGSRTWKPKGSYREIERFEL